MKRNLRARAFTLIEMIVVMAVSAILLTIIAYPLFESFRITRQVQADAVAQDVSRRVGERIVREIGGSAAVRDNTGIRGAVAVSLPGADGTITTQLVPSARLVLVQVAQGDPGSLADPNSGRVDPTLQAPKGQPVFPVTPGDLHVIYVVGLKDPFRLYNNPYTSYKAGSGSWGYNTATKNAWASQFKGEYLARQGSNEDNLYCLYRIEVNPYKYAGGVRQVNTELFTDLARVDKTALSSSNPIQKALLDRTAEPGPDVNDPYLLDPSVAAAKYTSTQTGDPVTDDPADLSTTAKAKMIRNLLRHSQIVTESTRMDLLLPEADKANRQVRFNSNVPQVTTMTSFRPGRVSSEPAQAQTPLRVGEDSANAAKIGPDVYRTVHGSWDALSMRIFPSTVPASFSYGADAGQPRAPWTSGSVLDVLPNDRGGLSLYGDGTTELFDVTRYQQLKQTDAAYAFSRSIVGLGGYAKYFVPVVPDPQAGQAVASFAVQEFGNPADRNSLDSAADAYNKNVPSSNGTDPGVATGPAVTFNAGGYTNAWATYVNPNERFVSLYQNWETFFPTPANAPAKDGPAGPKRYVSLRTMPMYGASRTYGPLDPRNGLYRVSITPGSEKVYGPDQSPGGDPTKTVLYQRVPNVDSISVGPNQYKINYVDKTEPDWVGVFGFSSVDYDPTHYSATDFLSAVLQERYRAGYLELNSRAPEPLPNGNIYVTYRFQFTEPRDVVTVSYDSAKSVETVVSFVTYGPAGQVLPVVNTNARAAEVRNLIR
jgi:prepilin-type N-terminal cleavage/methylation domain-containing protein